MEEGCRGAARCMEEGMQGWGSEEEATGARVARAGEEAQWCGYEAQASAEGAESAEIHV